MPHDERTFGRIRSALGAQHALEETGLSATEAARSGGISGYDASILAGGPERARRIMGIPVSEGIGGAVAGLRANPIALAINGWIVYCEGIWEEFRITEPLVYLAVSRSSVEP
jgi:hypothetical protein